MAEEHTEIIEVIDKEPEEGLEDAPPGDTVVELETDVTDQAKKKRRIKPVLFGSTVLIVVSVIVLVLALANTPDTINIEDANVPLSGDSDDIGILDNTQTLTLPKSDEPIGGSLSADSGNGIAGQEDNTVSGSGGSNSSGSGNNNNSNGGVGSGTNGSNGGNNSGQTWHPAWTEQVWVDTSGWQSVYIGENPIIQEAEVCNTCGAYFFGGIWDHIDVVHGSIGGWHTGIVQVGTEPIYETRWVESGYWETITHPGYWG